jgi:dTDP-4-amino-4,6-dideoxygalactose transaminase
MHDLGQAELESLAAVLATPILTTGEFVSDFEARFAAYMGSQHALGVTSCTGAAHMSLLALGIGQGDEVITTPMTFIASSTAIIEAGAKPVFVDVEADTGNLDANLIEAAITPKTKAIMPVHLYGQMCDMRAIREIADRHGLLIIEDAAHCVEGARDGLRPGQAADTACYSFYATKNLTSGEGGALTFNRTELLPKLKLLRLHGMTKNANDRHKEGYQHWDMAEMGWKYNMDNLQAAILLPQLARLEQKWERREALANLYRERLAEIPGLRLPALRPNTRHAWHLLVVWIENGWRDEIIQGLQAAGVGVMVNYRAIHQLSFFRQALGTQRGDFPVAEQLGDAAISLPFYPTMSEEQVHQVCDTLYDLMQAQFRAQS